MKAASNFFTPCFLKYGRTILSPTSKSLKAVPPLSISIVRQLRLLLMAKLLEEKGYGHGNIAQKMNLHSFVAQKVVTQSRNFTTKQLKKGLENSLKVDRNIKTGKMDGKLAVEMLIVEFANINNTKN